VNSSEQLRRILSETDAVIFDFDNVVVDSEPFHYEAYATVFGRIGHTIDREEYWLEWTSKGGGAEKEIKRFDLDVAPADIRREKDPIYSEYCRSGAIRPFPDALELIRTLHGAGFVLAIASGSYERDIRAILSAHGIEELFAAVVGKDDITHYKPHPETYLAACEELGLPPARCLAIEDAEKGIKSARAAGLRVIVVETDLTRDLGLEGADMHLSGIGELFAIAREVVARL
jgi:HAD superfamily hydrolase (TIGR01509 family)